MESTRNRLKTTQWTNVDSRREPRLRGKHRTEVTEVTKGEVEIDGWNALSELSYADFPVNCGVHWTTSSHRFDSPLCDLCAMLLLYGNLWAEFYQHEIP
jgi:hypothetical protein